MKKQSGPLRWQNLSFRIYAVFFLACFLRVGFAAGSAQADANVTMNVEASNTTSEKNEKVPIRHDLPSEIKKDDIIDAGGMEVRYDEEQAIYYLYAEVDLEPQEIKNYKVVVRDVWHIPEGDLNFLKEQADQRLDNLKGKENFNEGQYLRDHMVSKIEEIKSSQEAEKGNVEKRMELYRVGRQRMDEIRQKVILMDDFVKEAQHLTDVQKENKSIKFVIEAKNPSETDPAEKVEIKRYLPKGIQPDQIVDAQGFELKFDTERNLYYLTNTIDFQAGESKRFEISLSDSWHIPESRLDDLAALGSLTNTKLVGTGYEKLGAYLSLEIKRYIDEIKEDQKKAVTPEDKIAAYATDMKKIEEIKKNIERLRGLLEEAEKSKAKKLSEIIKTVTPDVATTWEIIYATIAFLTVISIFFYILWWGQTKAKQNQKIDIIKTPDKEK